MAVAGSSPIEGKGPKIASAEDKAEERRDSQVEKSVEGANSDEPPALVDNDEGESTKVPEPNKYNEDFAELVRSVGDFTKNLEPWKSIMPPDLCEQFLDLQGFSKTISEEKGFSEKPEPWLCEVKRYSMKAYKEPVPESRKAPVPVIEAFYRRNTRTRTTQSLASTESNQKGDGDRFTESYALGDQNLQRIQINSDVLREELQSVASVLLPEIPLVIPPPFKLLLRYLPNLRKRLDELEEELRKKNLSNEDGQQNHTSDSEQSAVEDDNSGSSEREDTDSKMEVSDKRVGSQEESKEDQMKKLQTRIGHLRLLSDLVQSECKDLIELRARIADGTLKEIAFDDLWYLFEPGDLIYGKDLGREQLYRVYAVTGAAMKLRNYTYSEMSDLQYARDRRTGYRNRPVSSDEEDSDKPLREDASGHGTWTPLKVDCYTMAYDGTRFGPKEGCKKIKHYVGKREITKLRMFPIRFHPDKERILNDMAARGTKFLKLSTAGHRSYEGLTVALKRSIAREEIESDVYVDFDAYYQKNPTNKPLIGRLLRSLVDITETSEQIPGSKFRTLSGREVDDRSAQEYLAPKRTFLEPLEVSEIEKMPELIQLLPHYVVGYAFRSRQWYFMDIDQLRDIGEELHKAQNSGFDDLVISKRYRDLLVALVNNHASGLQRKAQKSKASNIGSPAQLDIVRGKGQGLIILLHGPPGSGKTSTAETIAAYTRRPLYSITCGDLGLTPDVVETRLLEHTKLADKWGCVLLLDEADVFLMQRGWRDLGRNALVSVFLRQLEYYSGILFLTTNRPGVIDEAFKSRIHVSLRYPAIDLDSTKAMWNNILNRLERDNKTADIKVSFDREALLDFAERHYVRHEPEGTAWNGRQIRNAFQTALALAHYERLAKLRENDITVEEAATSGKKKWMTVRLTKKIFGDIARTAREFELYLGMLRGKDSDKAREEELRDDYNDPTGPPARKQYSNMLTVRGGRSPSTSSGAKAPKSKRGSRHVAEEESEEDEEGQDDEEEELSDDEDEDDE